MILCAFSYCWNKTETNEFRYSPFRKVGKRRGLVRGEGGNLIYATLHETAQEVSKSLHDASC